MTRRNAIAAAAGGVLFAGDAAPNVHPAIVKRHHDAVETALTHQITDPNHRGHGTLHDASGLYFAHSAAGLMESFMAA